MAQRFDIAIELDCTVREVVWSVAKGRPVSWGMFPGRPELHLRMTAPSEIAGERLQLGHGNVPPILMSEYLEGSKQFSATTLQQEVEVIACHIAPTAQKWRLRRLDPWTMRKDLLAIGTVTRKDRLLALVDFLNSCGEWSEKTQFSGRYDEIGESSAYFSPHRFWSDRDAVLSAMHSGISDWNRPLHEPMLKLQLRSEFPHLVLRDRFCLEAIFHSISIDVLRGTKYLVCPRKDCGMPFEKTDPRQTYCQQYCGHMVSQRKKRAERRSIRAARMAV
jgi:hypothetical protein